MAGGAGFAYDSEGAALFASFAKGAFFVVVIDRSRGFDIRIAQACIAKLVEAKAAPRPQLGVRDQAALHRIHVA
jgi:hypothetical protein